MVWSLKINPKMGSVYAQKTDWFVFYADSTISGPNFGCVQQSEMLEIELHEIILFNRMNLTAASLNNIQNENSIRPMMVVFFIHVLFTDNTKTYPCLIIILIPEIDWQAKIYYRIKNMIQTFLTLRIHVII